AALRRRADAPERVPRALLLPRHLPDGRQRRIGADRRGHRLGARRLRPEGPGAHRRRPDRAADAPARLP
ncbi:hypothetical protein DSI41_09235, partial [Mycobacterium tuberculosis]